MDKQTVVYSFNEILLNDKKKWASRFAEIWRNIKCILLSERKGYIHCYHNCMTSGKDKTKDTVKRSVVARVSGSWGMNRWSMKDFLGSEAILNDAIMWVHFVQTFRVCYTKNEPSWKLWTLVNKSYQYQPLNYKKCTTLI